MHALEEKNNLTNELTATRKKLEDLANIKVDIFVLTHPCCLDSIVDYRRLL
jgi:hypothetical protein